jgi:hypothetical protein
MDICYACDEPGEVVCKDCSVCFCSGHGSFEEELCEECFKREEEDELI